MIDDKSTREVSLLLAPTMESMENPSLEAFFVVVMLAWSSKIYHHDHDDEDDDYDDVDGDYNVMTIMMMILIISHIIISTRKYYVTSFPKDPCDHFFS